MMPHWDLSPGETVTLISPGGDRVAAVYETSDTLHVYFTIDGERTRFMRMQGGGLLKAGKRWTIDGKPRNTRALLAEMEP